MEFQLHNVCGKYIEITIEVNGEVTCLGLFNKKESESFQETLEDAAETLKVLIKQISSE
jgi:hypothetical protein